MLQFKTLAPLCLTTLVLAQCASTSAYSYKGAHRLSDAERALVYSSADLRITQVNDNTVFPGPSQTLALPPGAYNLTVQLVEYTDKGFYVHPQKTTWKLTASAGRSVAICPKKETDGKWEVQSAPGRNVCPTYAGLSQLRAPPAANIYLHQGDKTFQPKQWASVGLAGGLVIIDIDDQKLLETRFHTVYLKPGKRTLSLRLNRSTGGGSRVFSIGKEKLELDVKAGEQIYLCGQIEGKRWNVVRSSSRETCKPYAAAK